MNCLIVDDEPLAQDLLEDFVSKVPYLDLVKKCKSAYEALEVIQTQQIDLIFLDIQMPDLNGIEFAGSVKPQPMIIFTTAFTEYAVDGFELNAIDYLVKPIPFKRFLKATNKALEYFNLKNKPEAKNVKGDYEERDYIFVKSEYQTKRINYSDILYIEGFKDYIKIYTNEKVIMTLMSLKEIEEKLPSSQFVRVHRSFIISIKKIDSIQRSRVIIGEKWIPVGDFYKKAFFNNIGEIEK